MTSSTADAPAGFDARTRVILALLGSVVFIAVVNGTMINVALPHIGRDFGVSEGTYGWLVTGYSLTFGIFNAINGRLADVFGKKRVYMAGLFMLGACSLAVAAAPSVEVAIGVRLLQGAGAAALPVLGTSIIKTCVSPSAQGRAVGIILSTVGVAASIGPFLGGAIVQFSGWRTVFLVTGVALLALPAAWRLLPDELNETSGASFDLPGAILLGSGVASLLYGFELLESHAPTWQLLATLLTGASLLGAFYVWIQRARSPFVPPSIFSIPSYVAICMVGAVVNAARFGSVILASIMLDEVNALSPIYVGAVLFPGALAIATLSSRAGAFADLHGPRAPALTGLALLGAGALATAAAVGHHPALAAASLALFGVGYAAAQSPLISTINRIVPREITGAGVGLFMTVFFAGGAAGVAAAVTAIELGSSLPPLLPFVSEEAARFSNTFLGLAALCLLGLLPASRLPS
jgi:MFS family permease